MSSPDVPRLPIDLLVVATGLPSMIAERVRVVGDRPANVDGAYVLYWMRQAWRIDENPALIAAVLAARTMDLPVFVYQGVAERVPFASDRHHTFILEGARDAARTLRALGIGSALHVERDGHRGPPLAHLTERAALVVTDEMPVQPWHRWTERLARRASGPVWCVDAACLLPMRLVPKAYDRAFAFRRATAAAREERLSTTWPALPAGGTPFVPADLPFEPVDLERVAIPDLVAACDIDHTVAPVPHTPGGSSAGYRRWTAFRDDRLARYAQDRNNALIADGVSRLSPYLHWGQVSPFRIAREARAHGGDGADKFLDELVTWRELSWTRCFHRTDHDGVEGLPGWARNTLAGHQADPRPALHSWETMARGRTGDALWDAAQKSLLIHGELHNNVRMTWGKAVLDWTPDAESCWRHMVDLNHRYALDGQDPNSYAGLGWCLGLFDRPFAPERPILGEVRPRTTSDHARRLDVGAYARWTGRPALRNPPRVAVIGAGIAGLTCARTLADHAVPVTVFDKGRGPGGRTSVRRADGFAFDHGAQYFTARDDRFRRHVESWQADGLIAPWTGRFARITADDICDEVPGETRWVGVPGMNAMARHLARDVDVRLGVRVEDLSRCEAGWRLSGPDGHNLGSFDVLVAAVPAPQASVLLGQAAPVLAEQATAAALDPCWTVMAGFTEPLPVPFDAATLQIGPLAWIARNGAKPGRNGGDSWVLQASPDWSAQHLEDDRADVAEALWLALGEVVGYVLPSPVHLAAHRWRHARVAQPVGVACLFDPEAGIGACGDWCLDARIEAAFLSGAAMAGRVLGWAALPAREGTTDAG